MATTRSDRHRSSSGSGSQNGTGRKPRSSSSSSNRKPLQGRDTGYRIGSNRRQRTPQGLNPRLIVAGIVGILIVIALIFGISSCVKGCSSSRDNKGKSEETTQVNPTDSRVAFGVSADTTAKLAEVLDRNEEFAKLAKNADKIKDERLIDLAIAEPEAVSFVVDSVKADGSTTPYDATVPQGEYPKLYMFDSHWGYASYSDGIVGSIGSGPVALSMASMGLSGKTTYDPSVIAQAVHAAKLDTGSTGMDDAFVTNHGTDAGISATSVEASSDGILMPLSEGVPVIAKLKADSGVGFAAAHWVLITQLNSDNSINVYDPTSVTATSHAWSLGAVAGKVDSAYSLSPASGTTDDTSSIDDGSYDDGTGEEYYEEDLGY